MTRKQSPVDDFLSTKEAAQQKRRQDELNHLELWRTQGRRPEHLEPLLKAYEPIIAQKVKHWKAPAVNASAFRAELQKHLIGAFETYDPSRGAALNTHVENRLQKAKRYNIRYQNLAYIPEGQATHIGRIQKAQDELTEQFDRPPSPDEIADHIGMPVRQVGRILKSQRRDIPASLFESDPTEMALQRDAEVLELLPFNLTPDERKVFNYLYGREGHPTVQSTNEIARRLGKSPSQISRLRTSMLQKYQKYK